MYEFNFTPQKFNHILTNAPNKEDWYSAIYQILPDWDITSIPRVAGFMAQTIHESGNYSRFQENLNYSSDRLLQVFPKYFKNLNPRDYHRQPEKIANLVYANRMGNGPPESGDGWKFRGTGLIQITGRYNYEEFAKSVNMTLEEAIDYIATFQGAVESACWFWKTNNINFYCDNYDILGMTKRINGGTNGLEHREYEFNRILNILSSSSTQSPRTLRLGDNGEDVAKMQNALGIRSDGVFGPVTERILKEWQANNNLTPDGIAGPKTLSLLYS